MRVVLSTPGKFHTFDLARELHAHGVLNAVFTGYPRFKLKSEQLPQQLIHTFPWVHAPYMRIPSRDSMPDWLIKQWEYLDKTTLDYYVSRNIPSCDVFVGLSGSALQTGRKVKAAGAKYVCDRGSSHIRTQDQLLAEEYALWGEPYQGIDPRVIEREEAEYQEADIITAPSIFSLRSFIEQGVHSSKIKHLPYGVNLQHFYKVAEPESNALHILFAGGMHLRKGIPYLLKAFQQLQYPNKTLSFAGMVSDSLIAKMKAEKLWDHNIKLLGHLQLPQLREQMSRSHVLVLPSIEDGFGMVIAQAMACGCPVIATTNTGAEDIITDAKEGFIIPIRDADTLAQKLQMLADNRAEHKRMSEASLLRVNEIGGWGDYGLQAISIYKALLLS